MTLEPIEPEAAIEWYLEAKKQEFAKATVRSHRLRLSHFVDWCREQEIDNMNDLTGRDLNRYRVWRRNDGDLTKSSEKTQMDTVRVFVRWCESIDAVENDLSTKVQSPTLTADENTRDVMLDSERAEAVLSHLEKYSYASLHHVTFTLLWRTMMRRGAVRALDIDDFDAADRFLTVRHRPETDTPIKNGRDGERCVALSGHVCQVIEDWLASQRPEVTDENGRKPLLATEKGRPHVGTIQGYSYAWTRPCAYDNGCPHDRDPDECDAAQQIRQASKCPSSVSPHAIRRGGITHYLSNDVPETVVGDRANVSSDVLAQHYDRRTEREKMEQRRGHLSNI